MADNTVTATTMNMSNMTTTWKYQKEWESYLAYWRIAHWIDFGLRITLVFIGLLASILGLLAIYRTRMTRAYGFVRILTSLFISLFLNKGFVMVVDIVEWGHKWHWTMGDAMCRIQGFLSEVFEGGIAYQLIILSLYFLFCLKKPHWVQRLDSRLGSRIFLGIFWALVILFNLENLGAHSTKDYSWATYCWTRHRSRRLRRIVAWGKLIFMAYAPWFIVSAVAGYLYYIFRQENGSGYYRNGSPPQTRDYMKVTMSLAILLTICLGPRAILFTRGLLGYWKWHWAITFWVTLDIIWFLEAMYTTIVPFLVLAYLPDLRFECKCLIFRMLGKPPPVAETKSNNKKEADADDEANLI